MTNDGGLRALQGIQINKNEIQISSEDTKVLRELAKQQLEMANSLDMEEKRRLWYKHNNLDGERPMILIETMQLDGSTEFLKKYPLKCKGEWAKQIEIMAFRLKNFPYEITKDDSVIDPYVSIPWTMDMGSFCEVIEEHTTDSHGNPSISFHYNYPIKNLKRDFEKVSHRIFTVDREVTLAQKELLENILGDILPVKIHPFLWPSWTMGMTWEAFKLVGMEDLLINMYDTPDLVHKLMAFLRDDFIFFAEWLEREGLLTLNNNSEYIGSGSRGFTHDLPQKDYIEGSSVRLKDLWVLLESQETTGISSDMFEEFIFPYQQDMARKFGLVYYGCCEPLDKRWHLIKKINNLRSVSVSPWCDQKFMAEALGKKYVLSRKQNPALISVEYFDEDAIREDLRYTLKTARNCNLEILMKDVVTLSNHLERLARWVEIAREEIEKIWG